MTIVRWGDLGHEGSAVLIFIADELIIKNIVYNSVVSYANAVTVLESESQ
ncbi:MAG: hypothetical protein ACK4WD_13860 [Flavobacteriales bacterium]